MRCVRLARVVDRASPRRSARGGAGRVGGASALPLPRTEVSAAAVGQRDRRPRRVHRGRRQLAARGRVLAGARRLAATSRISRSASTTRWPSAPSGRAVRARRVHGHRRVAAQRCSFSSEGAWRALPRMPFPRAAAGAGVAARPDRRRRRHRRGPAPRAERARVRPPHAPLVGRPGADAARASRRDRARAASCTRSAVAPPASTRISCTSRASGPAIAPGGGCSRCPTRAAERARQRSPGRSSRSAARSREGRSRRCSRTASPSDAGCGSPDLPTPRHGVGVAALGGRVFVIGGGPEPGLTVSSANEALRRHPVAIVPS